MPKEAIRRSVGDSLTLEASFDFTAAADSKKPATFSMVANTGKTAKRGLLLLQKSREAKGTPGYSRFEIKLSRLFY